MKSKIFHNTRLASSEKEVLGVNDKLKRRIKTLETFISAKIKNINGLVSRNGGRGLIGVLLRYSRGIRPRSSKSVVRQVSRFVIFISKMASHSGLKGVVIYLKACQTILQQSVGGFRVEDLTELKVRPARNKAGVPLIIPAGVRVRISRDRDIPSIRLWMTLLGLYRVLEFPGKFSLETITQKGTNLSTFLPEWESFIRSHFKPLLQQHIGSFPSLPKISMFPILKSGPTVIEPGQASSSEVAMIRAARIYLRSEELSNYFIDIANNMGFPAIWQRLRMVSLAHSTKLDGPINEYGDGEDIFKNLSFFTPYPKGSGFLGRLGIKPEPAGKIRVFAMVDAWTQWVLSPLHKWIFSLLTSIKQDGTFDQLKPILALQKKFSTKPKGRVYASLDLSAATDRLPIVLQEIILKVLLEGKVKDSTSFAKSWRGLLTRRPYQLTKDILIGSQYNHKNFISGIYYSVGQPMGALSSWAMLALTHHAMMQYAYFKAYGKHVWYTGYGVLGDDGVVIGGRVIDQYRRLLEKIGVKAGLAKSIIARSRFVIEFAKKFFVDNTQANMLPIKECIASSISTSLILEFSRKYDMSLNQVLSFLGYGFKSKMKSFNTYYFNLGSRKRVLLVWLSHPSSHIGKSTYFEWLTQLSWKKFHEPSEYTVRLMSILCREALDSKISRVLDAEYNYFTSLYEIDRTLDKNYPITIVTSRDRGDYIESENFPYSWKGVLDPDLTKGGDSNFWDESFSVSSSHGYRWKAEQEALSKVKVGIDFEPIETLYNDIADSLYDIRFSDSDIDKINLSLEAYFALDDVLALIPEEFWVSKREDSKPYRDFLEIYSLWQDLSKPVWSEFNSPSDNSSKSLLPDPWKASDEEEESFMDQGPLVTMSDWGSEYVPTKERGDLEGQRNSFNHSLKDSKVDKPVFDYLWWFNFIKSSINWMLLFIVILVELLIFSGMIYFILEITNPVVSEPTVTFNLVTSKNDAPPIHLWLGSAGLGILIAVGIYSLYNYGSLWPMIEGVPEIIVTESNLGIQGPMTLDEYTALQRAMENQALLDNLAISPIGDLWVSPWT